MTSTEPYPTFDDAVRETIPLLDVVPVAGPPAIFLLAPWLFLVLVLVGPFAVLVTLTVVFVAALALVALAGAIVAAPVVVAHHVIARARSHHWHIDWSRRRMHAVRAGVVGEGIS
jgi:hypothetical protein